ncbi:hypothetical protein, partial [Bacillus thuringiensis]
KVAARLWNFFCIFQELLLAQNSRLENEGFDYLFPIRKVLETVKHRNDENPHLFKGCLVMDRDRGFYYEVVMRKVKR